MNFSMFYQTLRIRVRVAYEASWSFVKEATGDEATAVLLSLYTLVWSLQSPGDQQEKNVTP